MAEDETPASFLTVGLTAVRLFAPKRLTEATLNIIRISCNQTLPDSTRSNLFQRLTDFPYAKKKK